jgi:crossover junction endodeoxyribonuclease RusA
MIRLSLPWPPTVNHCYEPGLKPGSRRLTDEAKAYRLEVGYLVAAKRARKGFAGRLGVSVVAWPPDPRKRDLDNLLKVLLDSLQHAGVYLNDSQIDDLRIRRGAVQPGGYVEVEIQELNNARTDTGDAAELDDGQAGFVALGDRSRS